ncbi:hypothetical protein U1Q18_034482 [Sarracenia purpurea var. burkii]
MVYDYVVGKTGSLMNPVKALTFVCDTRSAITSTRHKDRKEFPNGGPWDGAS